MCVLLQIGLNIVSFAMKEGNKRTILWGRISGLNFSRFSWRLTWKRVPFFTVSSSSFICFAENSFHSIWFLIRAKGLWRNWILTIWGFVSRKISEALFQPSLSHGISGSGNSFISFPRFCVQQHNPDGEQTQSSYSHELRIIILSACTHTYVRTCSGICIPDLVSFTVASVEKNTPDVGTAVVVLRSPYSLLSASWLVGSGFSSLQFDTEWVSFKLKAFATKVIIRLCIWVVMPLLFWFIFD